jgi:hypothetical protein
VAQKHPRSLLQYTSREAWRLNKLAEFTFLDNANQTEWDGQTFCVSIDGFWSGPTVSANYLPPSLARSNCADTATKWKRITNWSLTPSRPGSGEKSQIVGPASRALTSLAALCFCPAKSHEYRKDGNVAWSHRGHHGVNRPARTNDSAAGPQRLAALKYPGRNSESTTTEWCFFGGYFEIVQYLSQKL